MNYAAGGDDRTTKKLLLLQKKKKKKGGGEEEKSSSTVVSLDPNSTSWCRFCANSPAAVCVDLPVVGRIKKRQPTPYCLRCYYSTSAVRQDPSRHVQVLNPVELDLQLPKIQSLFSEAFLELQQEISNEAELAFKRRRNSFTYLNAIRNNFCHHQRKGNSRLSLRSGRKTEIDVS